MAYVFEGRVKDLCFDCSNTATHNHVTFDVYTSFTKRGVKQYFAYEKSNSLSMDRFNSNIVEFEITKPNSLFDFISAHYRDFLEIEYEKEDDEEETKKDDKKECEVKRTITKVTLLND